MAKRGAAVQLTDRNWDNEDEPEEPGHFKHAGNEKMNKRRIKTATRRVTGSETSSAFKGFQGFGVPVPSGTSTPLSTSATFTGFKGFGNSSTIPEKGVDTDTKTTTESEASGLGSQYLKQLKVLNQSFLEWIKKHISQDPHVDLSPVFKDYETHLGNIDKKFSLKLATTDVQPGAKESSDVPPKQFPEFSGQSGCTEQPQRTPQFGFAGLSTPAPSSVSTVSSQNGGTFSNIGSTTETESEDTPKTDSQVRSSPEEGAFHSVRCKLFFKRADSWSELGVGMLSMKKVNNKTQVLVRNDTALGKILLNIFLGEATPVTRSGKNNVLLVSVPNPPVFTKDSEGDNAKPVSYLIRVKTSENADELHKQMEDSKTS